MFFFCLRLSLWIDWTVVWLIMDVFAVLVNSVVLFLFFNFYLFVISSAGGGCCSFCLCLFGICFIGCCLGFVCFAFLVGWFTCCLVLALLIVLFGCSVLCVAVVSFGLVGVWVIFLVCVVGDCMFETCV